MAFSSGQSVTFPGGSGHIIGVHDGGIQIVDTEGKRHVLSDADAASVTVTAEPKDAVEHAAVQADIVERERKLREGA